MRNVLIVSDSFRNAENIVHREGIKSFNRDNGTGVFLDGQRFKIIAPCSQPQTAEKIVGQSFGSYRFAPLSAERHCHPAVLTQLQFQVRPEKRGFTRV